MFSTGVVVVATVVTGAVVSPAGVEPEHEAKVVSAVASKRRIAVFFMVGPFNVWNEICENGEKHDALVVQHRGRTYKYPFSVSIIIAYNPIGFNYHFDENPPPFLCRIANYRFALLRQFPFVN